MESRNLSFLDDVSDDFKISTLHILKDGEEVDLAIEEIFDKDTFDHLIGVTYSISPSFVNKYLIDFASCELVIGIDNDYIKDSINRLAKHLKENILDQIQGEPIKFYDELAMKAKFNLDRGALKVWVSASHLIHSKFYLLWNDRGDKRLVLGSANLSQRAFDKASMQFENILILDDSSHFDTYMAYYRDSLSKVLTDYIPKDLKKLNAKTFKNISSIDEISADEVFIISNDQVANIKEKAVVDIIEDVKDKISLGICEDSLISQLDNIDSDRAAQKRDEKMKADAEEVSFELAKELINKRKNEPALYSKETISKKVRKKVEKISVREVENTSAIERVELFSKRDLRNSRKDMTGLFVRSSLNSNNLIPFGKKASQEDLARSLKCLNNYMKGFESYANSYTDDYGKRIFESILCIFTSPFIYELRDKIEIVENRLDIPQFIFIGGEAGSGKSSLLSIMSKLTGINEGGFYQWKDLLGTRGNSQKRDRIDNLLDWIRGENVNPILVDEIDNEFFTTEKYGKEFIVSTSNLSIRRNNPYPIMIGTTNTKSYALPKEARRRSYYLIIDRILRKSQESADFYKDIYESIDNTLFLDFCYRMALRLESEEDYKWDIYTEDNNFDFLYNSREIFKDYYEKADLPLPRYFPEKKYNDDTEANKEKWKNLYRGSRDLFVYDEETGHLFVNISQLNESYRTYGASTGQIYADALPQEVCVGSVHGVVNIELDTAKFLAWIEVENPYARKKSFIKWILGE